MEHSQFTESINEVKVLLKNANLSLFFQKFEVLVSKLAVFVPMVGEFEDDLLLLESRFNSLEIDIVRGIIDFTSLERLRSTITSACLKLIRLIEREFKFYNKVQEKLSVSLREIPFELKLDKLYDETSGENLGQMIKEKIENYLNEKISLSYIKAGSIIIGFSIAYDIVLAKKIKSIEKIELVENLTCITINDDLIEGYIKELDDLNLLDEPDQRLEQKDFLGIVNELNHFINELTKKNLDVNSQYEKLKIDYKKLLEEYQDVTDKFRAFELQINSKIKELDYNSYEQEIIKGITGISSVIKRIERRPMHAVGLSGIITALPREELKYGRVTIRRKSVLVNRIKSDFTTLSKEAKVSTFRKPQP